MVRFRSVAGDQEKPVVGPLAVKMAEPPEQIVALEVTMGGAAPTVTLTVSVTSVVHPEELPVMV